MSSWVFLNIAIQLQKIHKAHLWMFYHNTGRIILHFYSCNPKGILKNPAMVLELD